MNFSFEVSELENNICLAKVIGEISNTNENEFKVKLNETIDNKCNKLILDFKGVTYLNSTGLGILAAALKNVKSKGGDIKILNLNKSIAILFEVTKLNTIFYITDSLEDAKNNF